MAKSAKETSITQNTYDGVTIDRYLNRVAECWDKLDSLTGSHMNACGKVRKSIAGILEEAKQDGIPKTAMRALLKLEQHKRSMKKIMGKLEREDAAEMKQIAIARQDRVQLNLFGWAEISPAEKKAAAAARRQKFKGVSGADLAAVAEKIGEPAAIEETAGTA